MTGSEFIQGIFLLITTERDQKNADKIGDLLLREKLIACVSFKTIESHFWWEGEIDQSKEVQLIMKCKEENINVACQKIYQNHSYEIPEIIFFPVSTNKDYYEWASSLWTEKIRYLNTYWPNLKGQYLIENLIE